MSDRTTTEDQVRSEHLREVNVAAHWVYIAVVLGIGFVAMMAMMWVLGGS